MPVGVAIRPVRSSWTIPASGAREYIDRHLTTPWSAAARTFDSCRSNYFLNTCDHISNKICTFTLNSKTYNKQTNNMGPDKAGKVPPSLDMHVRIAKLLNIDKR